MRLIDVDQLKQDIQYDLCCGIACVECRLCDGSGCRVEKWIDEQPTVYSAKAIGMTENELITNVLKSIKKDVEDIKVIDSIGDLKTPQVMKLEFLDILIKRILEIGK